MTREDRTVISLVVLQNSMDLLEDEVGSCSKRYATSTADGNETVDREADRVLDIRGEGDQDQTAITTTNTEPKLNILPMVSV
jgi:hypothetical protein